MAEEPKRQKVPPFTPELKGIWGGERRRPDDPGTANRKQPARRFRQFAPHGRGYANESESMSHEQRLLEMLRGGVQ